MLAEVGVSLIVLAVAMIVVAQMLAAVATQRRVADQHALAQQEAANLMERLFAVPWAGLAQDTASRLSLSEQCQQRLPGVSLRITVAPSEGPPAGMKVAVEIGWRGRHGENAGPVRLTAWRYAAEVRE
jgi:hypothetical protein